MSLPDSTERRCVSFQIRSLVQLCSPQSDENSESFRGLLTKDLAEEQRCDGGTTLLDLFFRGCTADRGVYLNDVKYETYKI